MKVLVVVDVQHDFVDGALGTPQAEAVVPYVKDQIETGNYDKVIFTKDTHYPSHSDYIEMQQYPPHGDGDTIIEGLGAKTKNTYPKSSFGLMQIGDILAALMVREVEPLNEIHICGVCTDICVISNALILRSTFPTVPIFVHENGCAGSSILMHCKALDVMRKCCIEII